MTGVFDRMAAETDLRVVSNFYYGARQVTANKPVRTPADLNGLKIRTPDAPLYLTTLDIMGATATPMALSEVYLGLQQNTIDAQENPIPTIASAKFYEVQDYISITEHIVQGVYLVGNQRLLDSMDLPSATSSPRPSTTPASASRSAPSNRRRRSSPTGRRPARSPSSTTSTSTPSATSSRRNCPTG